MQESFSFATPSEVLGAIKLYCSDLYGGMLACLDGAPAWQLTNCWNTAVKDVWGLPRSTHTVFTRWLSAGHTSLREDLAARWPKFFRSLITGPSPEVAVVARLAAADARSTTAANNRYIYNSAGTSAWVATAAKVREGMRQQEVKMSEDEMRMANWLAGALEDRAQLTANGLDTTIITNHINHACAD